MSRGDWFPTFRDVSHLIFKGRSVREELIFVVFVSYLKLGDDHLIRCTLQFIVIHSYVAIKPLVADSTVTS